jgi:hypothetical protein
MTWFVITALLWIAGGPLYWQFVWKPRHSEHYFEDLVGVLTFWPLILVGAVLLGGLFPAYDDNDDSWRYC